MGNDGPGRTSSPATQQRPITRVVHVVESYGGGVAAAVSDYVERTPGLEHALIHADRTDAMLRSDMDAFVWTTAFVARHSQRVRQLASVIRREPPTTLFHAHSSLAGVYLRLASLGGSRPPTAYTPHCYAFERRDLAPPLRGAIYAIEKMLTRLSPDTVVAACSPREFELARRLSSRSPRVYVPNVAPGSDPPKDLRRPVAPRPVLVGAGRLSPQKDPGWFLACVLALRAAGLDVEAHWLGGGDRAWERRLTAAGIGVSGWLDRPAFLSELAKADIYVHSGSWEGFPITILEALSAGVPVVVRSVPSLRSFGFPTMADEPHDVVDTLASLANDSYWERVVEHGRRVLQECSSAHQAAALRSLYALETVPDGGLAVRRPHSVDSEPEA